MLRRTRQPMMVSNLELDLFRVCQSHPSDKQLPRMKKRRSSVSLPQEAWTGREGALMVLVTMAIMVIMVTMTTTVTTSLTMTLTLSTAPSPGAFSRTWYAEPTCLTTSFFHNQSCMQTKIGRKTA